MVLLSQSPPGKAYDGMNLSKMLSAFILIFTTCSHFPYCQQFGYISGPRPNILVSIAPSVDIRLPFFFFPLFPPPEPPLRWWQPRTAAVGLYPAGRWRINSGVDGFTEDTTARPIPASSLHSWQRPVGQRCDPLGLCGPQCTQQWPQQPSSFTAKMAPPPRLSRL